MTRSESVRWLLGVGIGFAATVAVAGELTLYEGENFQGRNLTLRNDMRDLEGTHFNDRAMSLVIRDGVWEVCSDAQFRGHCVTLQPGNYPVLVGGLDRRISSVRQVTGAPAAGRGYAPPTGAAKAILYEGPDFRGRSFAIDRNVVRNLDPTGFNDRAASLRVERGYWIFCSDANFEGDCRTFGPGDYPNLPGELNRRISSGRMISERYPYTAPPVWDRG